MKEGTKIRVRESCTKYDGKYVGAIGTVHHEVLDEPGIMSVALDKYKKDGNIGGRFYFKERDLEEITKYDSYIPEKVEYKKADKIQLLENMLGQFAIDKRYDYGIDTDFIRRQIKFSFSNGSAMYWRIVEFEDKRPFHDIYIDITFAVTQRFTKTDVETAKRIDDMFVYKLPAIKKVHFNDPVTVVIWADGTKTVVRAQNDEAYDPEKGLAMAISKKALGNKGDYYDVFKEHLPKKEEEAEKLAMYAFEQNSCARCKYVVFDHREAPCLGCYGVHEPVRHPHFEPKK